MSHNPYLMGRGHSSQVPSNLHGTSGKGFQQQNRPERSKNQKGVIKRLE